MCVGCRERGLRSVLLRVVAVTDGTGQPQAVVDTRRALPGRGAWLHPDQACLDLAERRRAFSRALRTDALDIAEVRQHLETRSDPSSSTSVVSFDTESGLEADGHPMSTQR